MIFLSGLFFAVRAEAAPSDTASKKVLFSEDFESVPLRTFPPSFNVPGASSVGLSQDPMIKLFRDFHIDANLKYLTSARDSLKDEARRLWGSNFNLLISGNLGTFSEPRWLEYARLFDFLNMEYDFEMGDPSGAANVNYFNIFDAIDKQVMIMPAANNNSRWRDKDDPLFYKMMVAETYASGHILHVPYNLYDGSFTGRWYGDPAVYADVFRFIRTNRKYFDGYAPITTAALILPEKTHNLRKQPEVLSWSAEKLAHHVPFRYYFSRASAGGKTSKDSEENLALKPWSNFESVEMLGELSNCLPVDQEIVTRQLGQKRIRHPDLFKITGASSVWIFPRAPSVDPRAPLVIHLLNKDAHSADGKTYLDSHGPWTLRCHRRLFDGKEITRAEYRIFPAKIGETGIVRVAPEQDGEYFKFELPELPLWGLLAIEAGDQTGHPAAMQNRKHRAIPFSDVALMRAAYIYPKPESILKYPLLQDAQGKFDEYKVLDAYGVSRVSWEYRGGPQYMPGYTNRGAAVHLTVNMGMIPLSDEQPETWSGWAQTSEGNPVIGRGDFKPPQYVPSPASPKALALVTSLGSGQLLSKPAGLQWDDVPFAVTRIWPQGGDFHTDFVAAFNTWLWEKLSPPERESFGVTRSNTFSIKAYIEQKKTSAAPEFSVRLSSGDKGSYDDGVSTKVFCLPFIRASGEGSSYWIGTKALTARGEHFFLAMRYLIAGKEGGKPRLSLYLKDARGSSALASIFISTNVDAYVSGGNRFLAAAGLNAWHNLVLKFDCVKKNVCASVDGGDFGGPVPFRNPDGFQNNSFQFFFYKNLGESTAMIDDFTVFELDPAAK